MTRLLEASQILDGELEALSERVFKGLLGEPPPAVLQRADVESVVPSAHGWSVHMNVVHGDSQHRFSTHVQTLTLSSSVALGWSIANAVLGSCPGVNRTSLTEVFSNRLSSEIDDSYPGDEERLLLKSVFMRETIYADPGIVGTPTALGADYWLRARVFRFPAARHEMSRLSSKAALLASSVQDLDEVRRQIRASNVAASLTATVRAAVRDLPDRMVDAAVADARIASVLES